jgi:hypothetical protein
MASCPRCGTALNDDHGMSQCPGCGAFCFIDMDGQASIQEHFEPTPGGAAASSDFPDPIEDLVDLSVRDVSPSAAESPHDVASNDSFDSFESMAPDSPGSADHLVTPDASSPVSEPEPISRAPQAFGPANDPLNLNDFANSEVSSAKDGPLLFRVLISGIDTKEIRESIREVLQDPRFAWDSNGIFSKVSKGHLAINDLSPVKASILITRIKRLPVQIRWEQYAITQGHQS